MTTVTLDHDTLEQLATGELVLPVCLIVSDEFGELGYYYKMTSYGLPVVFWSGDYDGGLVEAQQALKAFAKGGRK